MSEPRLGLKDTGVEWLGLIPDHWELAPFRALIDERTARNEGAKVTDYLSLMANVGVIPYEEKGDVGNKKPEDLSKCKLVYPGNLLINSMNYGIGSFGLSRYFGVCSPVYIVLKPKSEVMNTSFAHRLLQSRAFQTYAQSFGNGILAHRAAIGFDTLKALPMPLPPVTEQIAIAAFLDRETGKIDALVEEQKRLLQLLKEKRQAIISHAVTKGLDPNARMKPSGLEWLGDVPEHWEVLPLKRLGVFEAGAGFPDDEQGAEGEELPFFKVNALGKAKAGILVPPQDTVSLETAARLRAFVFPKGTIVFAKIGAALLLGRLRTTPCEACLDNNMMGYMVSARHSSDFLLHAMSLVRFDLIANPGTVPSLNKSQIEGALVAVPPREEQVAISVELRQRLDTIDGLLEVSEEALELLAERRSALISAAVTGKIDLRNIVARKEAA